MPVVFQAKGLEHCRNIRNDAIDAWSTDYTQGMDFELCLKMAIENHRRLVEEEIKMRIAESSAFDPFTADPYNLDDPLEADDG